jgi:hypothetical protein
MGFEHPACDGKRGLDLTTVSLPCGTLLPLKGDEFSKTETALSFL